MFAAKEIISELLDPSCHLTIWSVIPGDLKVSWTVVINSSSLIGSGSSFEQEIINSESNRYNVLYWIFKIELKWF